jgi:hypothetical protein
VVVLGGERRFPFYDVEHLKAAAAAARPLARDDKRLSDLIETATERVILRRYGWWRSDERWPRRDGEDSPLTAWPDTRMARDGGASMMKPISLACLVLSGALGCAADIAPTATGDPEPAAEQTAEGQSFEVPLPRDSTAESVIPAILTAGHGELAAACATTPEASIRIMNPLASGAFNDVSCAKLLANEEPEETSAALVSDPAAERSGEARQPITPVGGVLCSLASLIAGAAAANACKQWRGPNSEFCGVGGMYSGVAWITACYILL